MTLVTEDDVSRALEILGDEEGAAARAANEYMDSLTKSVLAELMNEANETSEAAKERWARSQPRFKEHLAKVGKYAREDYAWRQRIAAADAKIRLYQTASANVRAMERVR